MYFSSFFFAIVLYIFGVSLVELEIVVKELQRVLDGLIVV